ncbi:MAG: TolC family protein [Candidatus Omnitrophica bacterium]|nr:TolC family protein [Candidatus Omnitrophota bacterium]
MCGIFLTLTFLTGCVSPQRYREQADQVADSIMMKKQYEALGKVEPIEIETPADTLRRRLIVMQDLPTSTLASLGVKELRPIDHWPCDNYLHAIPPAVDPPWMGESAMVISLLDALEISARNSREYQTAKEEVYISALNLDFECDQFRNTFTGLLDSTIRSDRAGVDPVTEFSGSAVGGLTRRFSSGAELAASIGVDLVKLLSQDRVESRGVFADASVSIPLMRGSGRYIVLEDLTQAERDVVYSIYEFERFKRVFAVEVANAYLGVLRQLDSVHNAEENYKGLVRSTWRAKQMIESGRFTKIEVDQAVQSELNARSGWIRAQQQYERQLDSFKILLGLPTDANIELDPEELDRLVDRADQYLIAEGVESGTDEEIPSADATVNLPLPGRGNPGPYEFDPDLATVIALQNRLDLRVAQGRVDDQMREIRVSADRLRADVTLFGDASYGGRRGFGQAHQPNSQLDFYEGDYTAGLNVDLPFERTAERNNYRISWINLERATRDVQESEDRVKQDIRDGLRDLLETRENLLIQSDAVRVAESRVAGTELQLEAGQVEIRDVIEAREDLLSAQNQFTSAVVTYRIGELGIQRDMGLLLIDENGIWQEYEPN